MTAAILLYAAGVALGLVLADARPLERLALALLWPLGPLAFVVTMILLLGVAAIAFPVFGLIVAVGAVAAVWLLR